MPGRCRGQEIVAAAAVLLVIQGNKSSKLRTGKLDLPGRAPAAAERLRVEHGEERLLLLLGHRGRRAAGEPSLRRRSGDGRERLERGLPGTVEVEERGGLAVGVVHDGGEATILPRLGGASGAE